MESVCMPIGPTIYFPKERVFVDREACIQAFRENTQKLGTKNYNVLFFHGIAGIGKSKLQKELQNILKQDYPDILWADIDLTTKTYTEVGTFLITLRNTIQEKYKAKFYLFNTIHAIYWKKLHPESPLQKENYPLIKEGGVFSKFVDSLDEFGSIHAGWIYDIINNAPDNINRFFKEQIIDIDKLTAMEAHKLEKLLPGFFAADFISCLSADSKAYIFIDTYEALWEGLRDKGSFHEKDKWVRDNLIPNMLGISWVICGREKLLWASECDPDWKMYLEQHPVDELPESYCIEFLEDCGVENKAIRDLIIKASEGVPYYLNLSVDTHEKIKIYNKREPIPNDFAKKQPDIFDTFVKYLYDNGIRAFEVLSVPNFWDRDLFGILMKNFDPGLSTGVFSELIKFSFIKTDSEGRYYIHQLMRKSLQEYQDPVDRENVHQFMFEHYSDKLKEIDIKAITKEQEIALTEAFYHAKRTFEGEDLLNWFVTVSDSFDEAAFWQLITPMSEEILQILEAELGPKNSSFATSLNNLALLYKNIGDYDKALPLSQRALEIREKMLGPQHPDVASTLNNLALLYQDMGAYDKALPLSQRALEIREKVMGPQHPDVASTLNNLALLYQDMGAYDKALPLYQRALEIREKMLGPQHPDVATTLNNLARLYDNIGDYDKALPLYQRALEIREKMLGPQHPDVATTLNRLAALYDNIGDYDKAFPLYQKLGKFFSYSKK
jgi:tetratricopeptide (TPR) repeat protein